MSRPRIFLRPPLPDTDHPVSDVHPRSDVASSIDMTLEDIADDRERLRHSQEFHLPPIVRSRVEADIQQAYAFAITTALFAAFLISLAQIVEPLDAKTPAWRALRFFTYSSIVINLSGTTLALVLIKMCSEVQFKAHSMILFDPSSLPARIAKEGIPREILQNRYELLEKFGMPQGYKRLDTGAGFWVLSGNIFTFVSVLMWIWLVGDTVTSSVTTIVILFPICGIIYGIALTKG
ncbi:hypothetical protein FRC14_005089 [Serendipita sp. 396]|nr:hypothetical protein FRC14_005089 [Serendipita sp. 396]KAG8781502.1 hypothetical protein FRC15_008629 [Serendipita sp. 397]KAG8797880.1 hypothetical protein FRC16_008437 [Serendipita sp. 398]KAG8819708.1 hypothetical protein FRC19_009587 [Serendipita sp. 401]KAG8836331.1 hypothetical protein FRC18_011558 [Serendipita sp. 400]KAG8850017.1 hypothetical protein FRB91_009423 [Serendipita sp. 411]KAG8866391.1 hypothetical protein FRC20_008657 [Serendipita sp. 405]KAG9053331.1 hypothetical prot